jgi:hypothetical protein
VVTKSVAPKVPSVPVPVPKLPPLTVPKVNLP